MRTYVSFQSDSSSLTSGEVPPGRDLAQWLINGLQQLGVTCNESGGLDYAHDFFANVCGQQFYVMVGLVDDGVRQWLVSTDSTMGFIRRLFGVSDADGHLQLVEHIDAVLYGGGAISSIRWYTPIEWNETPDETWSEHPAP